MNEYQFAQVLSAFVDLTKAVQKLADEVEEVKTILQRAEQSHVNS